MATHTLDATGLRCPQPVLKVTQVAPSLPAGDVLEVSGDCPTFEADLRKWCTRMNKTLMAVNRAGNVVKVQIRL